MKTLKNELEKILTYLEKSSIDGYFETISVSDTKERVNEIIRKIDNEFERKKAIKDLQILIAPTGNIQEISFDNGWGKDFLTIANNIDKILENEL